jgi:putative endopeptidase
MMKAVVAAAIGLALACAGPSAAQTNTDAASTGTWGFDPAGRDLAVAPGDDFYRHANGAWLDGTAVPPSAQSVSSFSDLRKLSGSRITGLIEDISDPRTLASDPDAARLRLLHASFMDQERIETLGLGPLEPLLTEIRSATTHRAIAAHAGRTPGGLGDSLFRVAIAVDVEESGRDAVHLRPAAGTLPPGHLAEEGGKREYQAYIERSLQSLGWRDPRRSARDVVAFEIRMVQAGGDRRPVRPGPNDRRTVAELERMAPDFDWRAYFGAAGLGDLDTLFVPDQQTIIEQARVFAATPVAALQAWQAFHVLEEAAPYLPRQYGDARWDFRGRVMMGRESPPSREEQAMSLLETYMGDAVGRLYVARWFPPEDKTAVERMATTLREAMARQLRESEWLSAAAKTAALEKLAALRLEVGFPGAWRDYSDLTLAADDLLGNVRRASARNWEEKVASLGPDEPERLWALNAQSVNSYYSPEENLIVVPAGILQPPFFDSRGDPAVNYGAIAAILGHHIASAFDRPGSQWDALGQRRSWWTEADSAAFQLRAGRLAAQYDTFSPLPGLHVSGERTSDANLADLAGVMLGLEAWRATVENGAAPVIDGVTGEQRFFYGWAQVWRTRDGDDALRNRIAGDPHAPAPFRAVGPLRNIDAWYDAFDVRPGQRLYLPPGDRVRVW